MNDAKDRDFSTAGRQTTPASDYDRRKMDEPGVSVRPLDDSRNGPVPSNRARFTQSVFYGDSLSEQARERRTIDVPAAHHADDALADESIAQLHGRDQRRRAGALGQVVRRPQRQPDAISELVFAQRHDVVQLTLEDAEGQIERDARRHPLRKRRRRVADDASAGAPGARERVGGRGLDADNGRAAADPRPHDRAAARAAAAADRDEDGVDVRLLLEYFQTISTDAGDEQRFVGGVNVAEPALVLQLLDLLARFVEVAAALDQLGAIGTHRGVLLGVIAERHDNRARYALALTRERDRLPVVARGRGDHAAALVGAKARDQVRATAHLERAGGIVVLVLHPDVEPGLERQQRMAQQRRRPHDFRDSWPRGIHVFQGWWVHRHSWGSRGWGGSTA